MNLTDWIHADAETRNVYLEQIITAAETEIENQNRIIKWAREQISPATDEPVKHSIRWINTENLHGKYAAPVVVHGAECKDLGKIRNEAFVKAGFERLSDPESWVSAEGFATDYNADFFDEGGNEACFDIAFYPCTGMVEKTKILTGYDNR